MAVHRVANGLAKRVESVGLREHWRTQRTGGESAFGSLFHQEHQFVHGGIIARDLRYSFASGFQVRCTRMGSASAGTPRSRAHDSGAGGWIRVG